MKRVNLVTLFLAGIIGVSGVAHAASVSDSFDRDVPVQTSASSPNLIGTNYTIVSGNWSCSNAAPGYLRVENGGMMIDTSLQAINVGVTNFTLSAKILLETTTPYRAGGLIFNYQDSGHYYVCRFWANGFQFIKQVNTASTGMDNNLTLNLATQAYYTLSISSSGSTFNYSLSDSGGTIVYSNSVTDTTYSDGYAGFFQGPNPGAVRFDDYSLKVRKDPKINLIMYSSP